MSLPAVPRLVGKKTDKTVHAAGLPETDERPEELQTEGQFYCKTKKASQCGCQ